MEDEKYECMVIEHFNFTYNTTCMQTQTKDSSQFQALLKVTNRLIQTK